MKHDYRLTENNIFKQNAHQCDNITPVVIEVILLIKGKKQYIYILI